MQPLSLYKADIKEKFNYIRIQPLINLVQQRRYCLISNLRKHSKTIDAGSGYAVNGTVAHFGLRKGEKIQVLLSNGLMDRKSLSLKTNKTIKVKQ